MQIFHYHPMTGEFAGVGVADADPLDKDSWLVPAYSTAVAPAEPDAGNVMVFSETGWAEVKDHRGETWWDAEGKPIEIEKLGDPAAEGLTSVEPVPEPKPEPKPKPIDPLKLPLSRLDFWLVAAQVGVSKWSVRDKIMAMPDGVEKASAIAYFEDALYYRRNDPLLTQLALAEGLDADQLDSLWMWAS